MFPNTYKWKCVMDFIVFILFTKHSERSSYCLGASDHLFEFGMTFHGVSTAPVMAAEDARTPLHKGSCCPSGTAWEWECEKLAMGVHTVKGEWLSTPTTEAGTSYSPVPAPTSQDSAVTVVRLT